jgi:hypothetical protein
MAREDVASFDQSQRNLASCIGERNRLLLIIDTLRTNLSIAWTQKDHAEAKVITEHNKNKKSWGIGISTGYNPFSRLPYFGAGINLNIIRFSLRGLFKEAGGDAPDDTQQVINRIFK